MKKEIDQGITYGEVIIFGLALFAFAVAEAVIVYAICFRS